jgi:DNA-binding transcriptional regulator LsrR (DeoR family)
MARKPSENRAVILADVAEMYFLEGLTQAEIAKRVGVTRSMVSRMLTEAREKKIIKIKIERRFNFETQMQSQLVDLFGLEQAAVFIGYVDDHARYISRLGAVAAEEIKPFFQPGIVIGTAWGTTLDATINALEIKHPLDVKVVQLVGALGGRNLEYDSHGVVRRLVEKLGGEGYYLNVPYIVDKAETIDSLTQVQGLNETMELMKLCDVALLGIGSTELDYSTFYSGGYLILDDMRGLAQYGAVGNVGGLFFDKVGDSTAREFQSRSFTIRKRDLLNIPIRIGVAGGPGKIRAILGALRGKYINVLVTDEFTASEVLRLAQKEI